MKIAYVSDTLGTPMHARGIFFYSTNLIKLLSAQGHQVDLAIQKPNNIMNKSFVLLDKKHDVRDIIRTSIILNYLGTDPERLYRIKKFLYFFKQTLTLKWLRKFFLFIPGYFEKPVVIVNKFTDLAYTPASQQFIKHINNFLLFNNLHKENFYLPSPKINLSAYDLILIDTPQYVEIKKNPSAQVANVLHDLIPLFDPRLNIGSRLIFNKKMNKMLKISDKIIFISETTRQSFEKYLPTRKPFTIIYPIFEPVVTLADLSSSLSSKPAPKKNSSSKRTVSQKPTPINISTVVSDEFRKNIQMLIEAHSLLPNHYHLNIIGKINPSHYKVSTKQKKRVKFIGYASQTSKFSTLYTSDVVCFPSLTEGFGIPVLEGLYYTGRVVCSDIPVFREIAENYAQFCDPLSPYDIANKILYACSLPKIDNSTRELAVSPFRSAAQAATLDDFIK